MKKFVNITSNFEIGVFIRMGRYMIDAKSIMGIFSLDLTQPMELTFDTENNCDNGAIAEYIKQIEEFAV